MNEMSGSVQIEFFFSWGFLRTQRLALQEVLYNDSLAFIVIAYEINEIWSIDVAYVDKLAKYNNGVKYLLVAVDVLLRFLRVVPRRSKSAPDAAKAFEKMIEKVQPQNVWSDKGTEFKEAFKNLCVKRGIATYTTASETKSAFAERNIRSLKNIMYKHMENKCTYHYISKLSQFVSTINSRVNRVTKLAPNKVTKKHEPHLRCLAAEQSSKFVKNTKVSVIKFGWPNKIYHSKRVINKVSRTKYLQKWKLQRSTIQHTIWETRVVIQSTETFTNPNLWRSMDEFGIYLESAGSMNIYSGNTMAAFRILLAHPIHLEGDWSFLTYFVNVRMSSWVSITAKFNNKTRCPLSTRIFST